MQADVDGAKGAVVLSALESLVVSKSLSPSARAAIEATHATSKGVSLSTAWVHCRAAIILDAADKSGARTRDCGGAQIPASRRAALVAELAAKLPRQSSVVADLLAPFLASPDARVRAAILPAVVYLEPKKARPVFLEALASADPIVAAVAADTIVQQPPKYFRRPDLGMALIAAARRHAKSDNVEAIITLSNALFQYPPGEVDAAQHDLASHPEPSVAATAAKLDRHHPNLAPRLSRPASWLRLDAEAAKPAALPRTATLETSKGQIRLRFHPSEAPRTVANFAALARKGFYNGLEFHRVVPNFVIQGGDPRGDGFGGPGYTIPCEPSFNERPYVRGSVGMALAGRHTGGSQFFITHSAAPHLDGRYTNFATVTAGMDVVNRIVVGDKILRVTVD
jgi:cyclophilin family peptidyl-prolyl cis-trans isomerase